MAVVAGSLLVSSTSYAEVKLPTRGAPIPVFRADAIADLDAAVTGTVVSNTDVISSSAPGDIGWLKSGLDALRKGDINGARQARGRFASGSLDHQILSWAIALDGSKAVGSAEINAAALELEAWPGMAALRRNAERALYAEAQPAKSVVEAFDGSIPQTFEGVMVLARANLALGNIEAATAVLGPFWRSQKLEIKEEAAVLREFGAIIPVGDHRARMEQMLHYDRINSAMRVAKRAGSEQLAKAWGAVIRRDRKATKLLDAVPKAQRGAGYLFAKARQLRWAGKYRDAAEVMLATPHDSASLVDPDAWWVERRVLSREMLDTGDAKTAYKLAAMHAAESAEMSADAEFHAGWYALRGVKDATAAAKHFDRIVDIANGPISLARAYYWLGRSVDAGAPGDAQAYYEKAAAFGTVFYGQLAAAKIGQSAISTSYPSPETADREVFSRRAAVQAIKRLEAAGYPERADRLYRDLARDLTSVGEMALLAVMAEKRGDHFLALRIGKIAAGRGLDVGALAHPTGVIPPSANVSGAGKALAYAIARQESEFNIAAVSPAGARGLLQLLPRTAKSVAKKAGVAFSAQKLTTDAGYNATLGAAYLTDQLGRFDGSYVLTFAGYNAGPGRANEWISRYGDPRGKDIDTVVDWIERIPFTETRNYVQRVMENYQVYKMRLSGRVDIVADLCNGR